MQTAHPAFPVPSIFWGWMFNNSGAFASREGGVVSAALLRPILETQPSGAPQDEVVTRGAKSNPHGEEARRAVPNHEAVEGTTVV